MLYRPKTQTVVAVQWTGENEAEMREWMEYAFVLVHDGVLIIENHNGRVSADPGDMIVLLDDGFYPMEPALFSAKYEAAKC